MLAEEIELQRRLDSVAAQRRQLPAGPVVAKDYRFIDINGTEGEVGHQPGDKDTLVTLFLDVRAAARAAVSDVHQLARRA